jgi:hypothetical protein
VGYDISPLKRVKLKILTTSRHASGRSFRGDDLKVNFYQNYA